MFQLQCARLYKHSCKHKSRGHQKCFLWQCLKGHVHNVSAYSRRSVNVRDVVNFASTLCTYDPEQSTFPCSSGRNPSEQKPNQTITD